MESKSSKLIKVSDLDIFFKNKKDKIYISQSLNFEIDGPCILGVIGPNGVGKTTLFKTLLGLHVDYNGKLEMFGKRIKKFERDYLVDISYAPDNLYFSDNETGYSFIKKYTSLYKKRRVNRKTLTFLIEKLDLKNILHKRIFKLSKGQKKSLLILNTFLNNSRLILMDEPFEGLDYIQKSNLVDILKIRYNNKSSIFISSHEIEELRKVCTHLIFLKNMKCSNPIENSENLNLEEYLK